MNELRCETEERDGAWLLTLSGRLSHEEMETFEENAGPLVRSKPRFVAVDLAELETMTSAGIGAILQLRKRLEAAGSRLLICGSNPRMTDLLNLTRIDAVVPIYDSFDAAVAAMPAPSPDV